MLFSLLMLRSGGDNISRIARQKLQSKHINFREEYAGDYAIDTANGQSVCRLTVNGTREACIINYWQSKGRDMGNIPKILEHETPPDPDVIARIIDWIGSKLCKKKTPSGQISPSLGMPSNTWLVDHYEGSVQGADLGSVTLFGGSSSEELAGKDVVLVTDAHSWLLHFKTFYSIPQYVGAAVIMFVPHPKDL